MLAVTMETAAEGVEASLASLVSKHRGGASALYRVELFWLTRVRLPWLQRLMTRGAKSANRATARLIMSLLNIGNVADFYSTKPVDLDLRLRDVLERVKEDAIESRDKSLERISALQQRSSELKVYEAELRRGVSLAVEMFNVANQIQWKLAEHDSDVAARLDGFVASSYEETNAILDRILAGG
jgi:hypothetical protein